MTPVSCCLMKRLAKSSDVGRSKMCSLTCQLASSVARWLRQPSATGLQNALVNRHVDAFEASGGPPSDKDFDGLDDPAASERRLRLAAPEQHLSDIAVEN